MPPESKKNECRFIFDLGQKKPENQETSLFLVPAKQPPTSQYVWESRIISWILPEKPSSTLAYKQGALVSIVGTFKPNVSIFILNKRTQIYYG